jgi:hypothetical protein
MAVCEDAPCCGCCGQIAWAREDQAQAEARMDYDDDHGPVGYEPDEIACPTCNNGWAYEGEPCDGCGEEVTV